MARVKGRDTKPEMLIRRALHARGFRYRLHVRDLPGRPDIVLPKHRAAILIHGCFWHAHGCRLFKKPGTRPEFWEEKLAQNRARDARDLRLLQEDGWRTLTIWECSFRGKGAAALGRVADDAARWLVSDQRDGEIADANGGNESS